MSAVKLTVVHASSLKQKTFGLIGKKSTAMLFKTRFGIHTFGMRYPIDVIILDKNNCVVKIKENLAPNRIFLWPLQYNTVIELPSGIIKEKNIKQGTYVECTMV